MILKKQDEVDGENPLDRQSPLPASPNFIVKPQPPEQILIQAMKKSDNKPLNDWSKRREPNREGTFLQHKQAVKMQIFNSAPETVIKRPTEEYG